ncbi:MAG: RDD family protein [Nitrospirae bacterium]|nr:RDD family protein [Nitrospirota bacterium]
MQKANVLNRFVAKFIDLLVAFAYSLILEPVGYFAGITYLLIADGFFDGRSVGKKLIRLQTLSLEEDLCSYRDSILRNLPIGLAYLLFFIPYIGKLLFAAILILEGLLVIGNDKGHRIGDELAGTQVIDGYWERNIANAGR